MKKVLILGAGFVSRPGVRYLLDSKVLNVTVADIFPERAEELVHGYENGKAMELDINDTEKLENVVKLPIKPTAIKSFNAEVASNL